MEYNESIINNIILFEKDFRYLSFATYSNGDMIFSSKAYPKTEKRIFYGFKNNGRPFFKNETSYFYSMNSTKGKDLEEKFESDSLVIELSDESEKEYLISTSKVNSYVEIYDFENNDIYKKSINDFTNHSYVGSFRNLGIFLSSNGSDHYYLFGFTIKENENLKISLQIHKFNEVKNFNNSNTLQREIKINNPNNNRDGISCFTTENQTVMCFYITQNITNMVNYNIIAYDINLQQKGNIISFIDYNNSILFYRCIHLKEEIGVFFYYKKISDKYYPILLFKQFSNEIVNYTFSQINLNKYIFDTSLLKNDLIKLKEDKICFSSILKDKTTIFIILINLFKDDTKYRVRYYSINLYKIYNYKIYLDIRTHNYNNFISFSFSYSENNGNTHFAALMLFSYPNSTDNSSDLYEFLINNYNSTINDFSVNLENEVNIENNIFGYVFDSILIQNTSNCLNPQLISSLNKSIESNTSLSNGELIKLKFNGNNYSSFNCNIEYIPILTEPDLNTTFEYPIYIEGQNEESDDNLMKEKYKGRLTYYDIYLNESLSDNCNDVNCLLCLNKSKSYCITCKYSFTLESSTKEKYCKENINSEIVHFTEENEKTNIIYESKADKKDSDAIKTEIKNDISIEIFNTEEMKEKNDIDTNTLDKSIDKSENTNINKEEITKIDTDINIETYKKINNITKTENINEITEEKMIDFINEDGEEKIKLNISKNELNEEISNIIKSIKIGENYKITGEDFIMSIRPTKSFINSNSTHVDFSTCENILRNSYHIDEPRIITFLQLEIMINH